MDLVRKSKLIKTTVLSLMVVVKNLISKLDVLLSNNKLKKLLLILIEKIFKRDLLSWLVEFRLLKLVERLKLKYKKEKIELKML